MYCLNRYFISARWHLKMALNRLYEVKHADRETLGWCDLMHLTTENLPCLCLPTLKSSLQSHTARVPALSRAGGGTDLMWSSVSTSRFVTSTNTIIAAAWNGPKTKRRVLMTAIPLRSVNISKKWANNRLWQECFKRNISCSSERELEKKILQLTVRNGRSDTWHSRLILANEQWVCLLLLQRSDQNCIIISACWASHNRNFRNSNSSFFCCFFFSH